MKPDEIKQLYDTGYAAEDDARFLTSPVFVARLGPSWALSAGVLRRYDEV